MKAKSDWSIKTYIQANHNTTMPVQVMSKFMVLSKHERGMIQKVTKINESKWCMEDLLPIPLGWTSWYCGIWLANCLMKAIQIPLPNDISLSNFSLILYALIYKLFRISSTPIAVSQKDILKSKMGEFVISFISNISHYLLFIYIYYYVSNVRFHLTSLTWLIYS